MDRAIYESLRGQNENYILPFLWMKGEEESVLRREMAKIDECLNCRKCTTKCPYELNTPELLKKNLDDYRKVLSGEVKI